jgi:hypothetical protein
VTALAALMLGDEHELIALRTEIVVFGSMKGLKSVSFLPLSERPEPSVRESHNSSSVSIDKNYLLVNFSNE